MFESGLPGEAKKQLALLLDEFRDVFVDSLSEGGKAKIGTCHIRLVDDTPVAQSSRRLPPDIAKLIEKEVQYMLQAKVIEPSRSSWSSPIVAVRKKDGSLRICIDFRELNKRTSPTPWPFPNPDQLLGDIAGADY